MDIDRYIIYDDLNDTIKNILLESQPSDLKSSEKAQLVFHMEIHRHILEIVQLYKIFRFNMLNLRDSFHLTTSDDLVRNKRIDYTITQSGAIINENLFDYEIDDLIRINALTINFISSGKTLAESIEVFVRDDLSALTKVPEGLSKEWISKIYDENFHYRFITHLRDYSQHGHLPVSVNLGKYGFDFYQILNTPHFKHNSTRKKQFENIIDEILELSGYPRFTFTPIIAEYNLCVTKMYVDFLCKVKSIWRDSYKKVKEIAKCYPSKTIRESKAKCSIFTFFLSDDSSHSLNIADDAVSMFNIYIAEAKKVLNEEQAKVNTLRGAYKTVKPCKAGAKE